jgi:hypothetical protein
MDAQTAIRLLQLPSVCRLSLCGCQRIGGSQARTIVRSMLAYARRQGVLCIDLTDTPAMFEDDTSIHRIHALAKHAGITIQNLPSPIVV